MVRWIKRIAVVIVCALALLLYREWVERHAPKLFLPLGFFETSMTSTSPEGYALQPSSWEEPLHSLVVTEAEFEDQALSLRATTETGTDVLVMGATLGGSAAALAAADDGVSATLVTEGSAVESEWTADATSLLEEFLVYPTNQSQSERLLRSRLRGLYPLFDGSARGMPSDIQASMRSRLDASTVRTLEGYTAVAFTGPTEHELNRVLLHSQSGGALVLPFSLLLDGSTTGNLYPLTDVPYDVGMNAREETNEAQALPRVALAGLGEGYSMSGHTIAGIGKRLDGASDVVALLDRGYNGTSVAPESPDPSCWDIDAKTKPFVNGDAIWRTRRSDCEISYVVESRSEDVVDVFAVKDGNDAIDATIVLGEARVPFSFRTSTEPKDRFVYLGAFPLGAGEPLRVTLRATLPTDRFESLIVRKRNAPFAPRATVPLSGTANVEMRGWRLSEADVLVSLGEDVGAPELVLNETPLPLTLVGERTWKASNVVMPEGYSSLQIRGATSVTGVVAIPIRPHRNIVETLVGSDADPQSSSLFPLLTDATPTTWELSVKDEGDYVFTVDDHACVDGCGISISEPKSLAPVSSNVARSVRTHVPDFAALDIVHLRADRTYLVTLETYLSSPPPIDVLQLNSANADLFAIGAGFASIKPEHGALYDVWVRATQSTSVSLDTNGTPKDIAVAPNELTYLGVQYVSPSWGLNVFGGGMVSVLAVPNTYIDTYRHRLAPSVEGEAVQLDVPPGPVSAWMEGEESALSLLSFSTQEGVTRHMSFGGANAASDEPMPYGDGERLSLSLPSGKTAFELVLYEAIVDPRPATASGALLQLLPLANVYPMLPTDSKRIANGSGIVLLRVSPDGVGPVTLGMLGSSPSATFAHGEATAAARILRSSWTSPACGHTPDCDPRRLVPAPFIFHTNDAHVPSPLFADGRRLRAVDTLSTSGAYLREIACDVGCSLTCANPVDAKGECIAREQSTDIATSTVLTIDGTENLPTMMSSREQADRTLTGLLNILRADGLLDPHETYVERSQPARPVQLSMGMFSAPDRPFFIPANATIGATHAASRALRSARTRLAIGEAAGHIASFSLRTHASPQAISDDQSLLESLRVHLVESDVRVYPIEDGVEDPLLQRALQRLLLQGETTLAVRWDGRRLRYTPDAIASQTPDPAMLESLIGSDAPTMRSLLLALSGNPNASNVELFRVGALNGMISTKLMGLNVDEIMQLPIDTPILLKAYELLQHPVKSY